MDTHISINRNRQSEGDFLRSIRIRLDGASLSHM